MKAIGYLLLAAFIISNIDGLANYSIKTFIDYLQESGQYDIIFAIRKFLGNDVAIEYCKQLVETEHCDDVVRVYMNKENDSSSSGPRKIPPKLPSEDDLNLESQIIFDKLAINNDDEKREMIIIILSFYDILNKNMTDVEIYDFLDSKILKRRRIIPLTELEKDLIKRKIEKLEKIEKAEKIEKLEKIEKAEKIEKVENTEKKEKEKVEKFEKVEKVEIKLY